MASLAEILKDKKSWPDDMKFALGNGVDMTLGELRAFEDASGQDVAKTLEAERAKLADEQKQLTAAQEEVVKLWTALNAQPSTPAAKTPVAANDWSTDPFFAPIATAFKSQQDANDKRFGEQSEQVKQFQKALGLGVKYISDVISEMRYGQLPVDFRKSVGYADAIKQAADRKMVDAGGVPDVRKVYDEWESPRRRDAELKKVKEEAYEKARTEVMQSALARPSGVPSGGPVADANAPKTIRDSFQRLKEDPEFLNQIYNLTGQSGRTN